MGIFIEVDRGISEHLISVFPAVDAHIFLSKSFGVSRNVGILLKRSDGQLPPVTGSRATLVIIRAAPKGGSSEAYNTVWLATNLMRSSFEDDGSYFIL